MNIKKFLFNFIPNKELRKKLRNKYCYNKVSLELEENSKCLVVCPHADDELIGVGGLMLLSPKNFDVICIGSSGVPYKEISAQERSNIRIKEFNNVMKKLGVNKFWIFETYGKGILIKQIKKHFQEYLATLDTTQYDYIFMPVPHDRHPEHKFITNKLMKSILKENKFKGTCKIVFYEVWSLIPNPNCFIDISKVINQKEELLKLYVSQHVWIDYATKTKCLNSYRGMQNDNTEFSEAFYITDIKNYLKKGYNIPL